MNNDDRLTRQLLQAVPIGDGESSADWLQRVLSIVHTGMESPVRTPDWRRLCACGCGRPVPTSGRVDRKYALGNTCAKRAERARKAHVPSLDRWRAETERLMAERPREVGSILRRWVADLLCIALVDAGLIERNGDDSCMRKRFLVRSLDHHDEPMSVWDGVWWAITTVTTVGYGDFSAKTAGGRAVAIAVMLIGIGFVAIVTAATAERFMRSREAEAVFDGGERGPVRRRS